MLVNSSCFKKAMRVTTATVIIMALIVTMTISITSVAVSVGRPESVVVFINGEELHMDVPARIINSRTMIPVRAVSEALGCYVEWFPAEQQVIVFSPYKIDDPLISMTIGNQIAEVYEYDGKHGGLIAAPMTIDSPPVVIDGRTLVPLRFIAEGLGFEVSWDQELFTVYISAWADGDIDCSMIKLSADEARSIMREWLDAHPMEPPDALNIEYDEYIEEGEEYYWFTMDNPERYWLNFIVHKRTGEVLLLFTPDGLDTTPSIFPPDEWYSEHYGDSR